MGGGERVSVVGVGGTNFSLQSSLASNMGRKKLHNCYNYNCVKYEQWTVKFKPKDSIQRQWEKATTRELFSAK